jgi:concanavalin A-like lectin/glucanase superfamily protein/IPT/TIG domain-containing protein
MKSSIKNILFILALFGVAALYHSCTKGPNLKTYTYPAPLPQAFNPGSGYPGTDITITGASFGDYKNAVKVFFNGVKADTIKSCTDGQIVVRVPDKAVTGKVTLQVWTNTVDSIGTFTVIPAPVIKSVSADAGTPGDTVIIKGAGFGANMSMVNVSFNGTNGAVNALADTMIKVIVPTGFSSGNIIVYVNNYPVTGPGFAYLVPVPNANYQLDFDGDLTDKMGGTAATYIQGAGAAISYVTGINGKAVYLPGYANASGGINQTISLPAQISKYSELTVTCWVNWLGQKDQEPVFDFGETRGNRLCLIGRMPGWWNGAGSNLVSRLIFENKTGFTGYNEYNNITSKSLPVSSWHHLAVTVSYATNTLKVYLDAALIGTKTLPAAANLTLFNHNRVYVGGPAYGVANEPAFGGSIDKFQLFNSVLDANQIYTIYYKK